MVERPILVYGTGSPAAEIAASLGTFEDWFERLLARHPVSVRMFDGQGPALAPDVRDFAGVIITGSPASLTAPEPWMEMAISILRAAAQVGTPILGVCFGHQLIGAAFGAGVVENPAGWEVSTLPIELTAAGRADPLFAGLDGEVEVNFCHRDVVDAEAVAPSNGLTVLASNAKAKVQALAAGDSVRGVQFHPEFDGAITRAYVRLKYRELAEDAEARGAPEEHPDRLLERAADTPWAERIFSNWVTSWAMRS